MPSGNNGSISPIPSHYVPGTRPASERQDDLAAGMPRLELPVGVLDQAERERPGDWHLELAVRDQPGELRQHAGTRSGRVGFDLDSVPSGRVEPGDRVDAGRLHAKGKGELDVVPAERVDERVDLAGRLPDPVRDSVAVGYGNHSVPGQPVVIGLAGQSDH